MKREETVKMIQDFLYENGIKVGAYDLSDEILVLLSSTIQFTPEMFEELGHVGALWAAKKANEKLGELLNGN